MKKSLVYIISIIMCLNLVVTALATELTSFKSENGEYTVSHSLSDVDDGTEVMIYVFKGANLSNPPTIDNDNLLYINSATVTNGEISLTFPVKITDNENTVFIADGIKIVAIGYLKNDEQLILGDINGDKKINIIDLQSLYKHINETKLLDNSIISDINGDKKINSGDLQKLYNLINETNPLK